MRRTPIGDFEAYRVNGTPADCVALGANNWEKVDLVLSGINLGPNLGNAIWHSGTLAAAKQAALLGLRGIALSTPTPRERAGFRRARAPGCGGCWSCCCRAVALAWSTSTSRRSRTGSAGPGSRSGTTTAAWSRDRTRWAGEHYWFTVVPMEEAEEGTDRWAVEQDWSRSPRSGSTSPTSRRWSARGPSGRSDAVRVADALTPRWPR